MIMQHVIAVKDIAWNRSMRDYRNRLLGYQILRSIEVQYARRCEMNIARLDVKQ